jgi:hypothetical protein
LLAGAKRHLFDQNLIAKINCRFFIASRISLEIWTTVNAHDFMQIPYRENSVKMIALASVLATLCAPLQALAATAPNSAETRIFVAENCPASADKVIKTNSGFGGAILGAVAGPLIDAAINAGVAAVKAAAEDHTVDFPVGGPKTERFYQVSVNGLEQVNKGIRCITVVSGHFGGAGQMFDSSLEPRWLPRAMGKIYELKNVPMSGNVDFYFEAEIVTADDPTLFSLNPRAMYVGDFIQTSIFTKERNFALELQFQDLASSVPYANFSFKFPGVTKGFSRLTCSNPPQDKDESCIVNALGSPRLWFKMQPQTDEMKNVQIARKQIAARLGLLTDRKSDVGKTAIDPELLVSQTPTHRNYCAELARENLRRPAALYKADETCSPEYYLRQTEASNLLALKKAQLDYVDAFMLYEQKCGAVPQKVSAHDAALRRNELFVTFPAKLVLPGPAVQDQLEIGIDPETIKACLMKIFGGDATNAGQFMMSAEIHETKLGSKFANWLAPAAEAAAPEVKTVLQDHLIKSKREAAEKVEQAKTDAANLASRNVKFAIQTAEKEVRMAEIALAAKRAEASPDPGDLTKLELALLTKQYAANNAYRAADMTPPYADVP